MTVRNAGKFGLLAGALALSGCADESPPVEVPPVVVTVSPDTLTLVVGATRQLNAAVTNNTNQAVIWRSSNAALADINASGLVTARAVGAITITALAQADTSARDNALVSVIAPPPLPANATVSIIAIKQGGLPAHTGDLQGAINIAANVDVLAAGAVSRVEFVLDSSVVAACTQNVAASAVTTLMMQCDLDSAAHDTVTGVVTHPNGARMLTVRALRLNGTIAASASQNLVFNNPSFLIARISAARGPFLSVAAPRSLAPAGRAWYGGNITVTVLPVLYRRDAADSISQVTVLAATSGAGVSGVGACISTGIAGAAYGPALHDHTIAAADQGGGPAGQNSGATPNCPTTSAAQIDTDPANGFSLTFPDTLRMNAGGLKDVEESLTFSVQSVSRGGQPGPVCINPGPANPLVNGTSGANCGTGLGASSAPNQLLTAGGWLHDNLAPRFTSLSIRRDSTLLPYYNTQALHAGEGVAPIDTLVGAHTVDYGAGGQLTTGSTVFLAGTSLDSMAEFSNTRTLSESATRYFFQARTRDGLNNSRTGTATTLRFVSAAATGELPAQGVSLQHFGVDFTAPAVSVTGPSDNSATANSSAPGTYALMPSDPGTGPSGFVTAPFKVKAEHISANGTICRNLETAANVDCSANGGTFASDGAFDLPAGMNGYWRITWRLFDRAGNATEPATRVHLVDATFPVVGAITVPAVLAGGQNAVFTAQLADDVELKDALPFTRFAENGIDLLIQEPSLPIGSYGPDPIAAQSSGSTTITSFIRSIETTTADLPTSVVARATHMNYTLRDMLDNTTSQATSLLAAVVAGIGGSGVETSWRGAGRAFSAAVNPVASFRITTAPRSICVDSDGDGCSAPASIVLSAAATGPAFTFANPFARLNFYYRHPLTGRLVLIGTATASSSDNGAANTRTWTYTGVSLSAPSGFAAGTTHSVIALGIDLAGRALASGFVAFTQSPD